MPDTPTVATVTDTVAAVTPETLSRTQVKNLESRGFEVWQIQIPGTVHLRVLMPNRFGGLQEDTLTVGPNRRGHQFRISRDDREDNQQRCVDATLDPFRNGILVRVDADQQADPDTASVEALDTEKILDIFDLDQPPFELEIEKYGEIPLRNMVEIGVSMDVSHRKLDYLRSVIEKRYSKAKSQSLTTVERLS